MKKSHTILIFVAVYFLIFGVVGALYKPDYLNFLHMILNSFFAFIWCKTHAIENNKKTGIQYLILALLFPVIGLSIYLFKFFEFKIGALKTLQVILFYMFCLLLYLLPFYYL